MKAIELTQTQIKAIENGASMVMVPIDVELDDEYLENFRNVFIKFHSPIQKGDKFFIQEDFVMIVNDICEVKQLASQMTYEQSRFKDLECVDVRVVRIDDISFGDWACILGGNNKQLVVPTIYMARDYYNQQMKEQNINRTYEDNDYVFLVEFKYEI